MLILLFFTFAGFVLSLISYLLLLFRVDIPSDFIAKVLNTTMVSSIIIRILLTHNLRQTNDWFFDISIKGICPHRLKMWTKIIAAYGIGAAVISAIGIYLKLSVTMTQVDFVIASRRLFLAVFSSLFAIFAIEVTLNICFWILKKRKQHSNDLQLYRQLLDK